jgi:hypothetical protein
MEWIVVEHPEFASWFDAQSDELKVEIGAGIRLLQEEGPALGRPRVDTVRGSKFTNMKELRVQYRGQPYRILFAFDLRRQAVLLVGGLKSTDKRWYRTNIPIAEDRLMNYFSSMEKRQSDEV